MIFLQFTLEQPIHWIQINICPVKIFSAPIQGLLMYLECIYFNIFIQITCASNRLEFSSL